MQNNTVKRQFANKSADFEDDNLIYWNKDRLIGEMCHTADGRLAEIIDIGDTGKWNDLTLLYEDGSIEEHKSIYYFGGYYNIYSNILETGVLINHFPIAHYLEPWYFGFSLVPGRIKRQKNGLVATIICARGPAYSHTIEVRWEDGEYDEVNKASFTNGTCGHRNLKKNGIFHGFAINKVVAKRNKGKAYFEAMCLTCEQKGILTPQQMIEHEKKCQNQE